jgi:sulfatase maturation enzyme AslB (radical SAM superfamily)
VVKTALVHLSKQKHKNMDNELQSTLTAIQDEINQYYEGNLTIKMTLNGIKELIQELKN